MFGSVTPCVTPCRHPLKPRQIRLCGEIGYTRNYVTGEHTYRSHFFLVRRDWGSFSSCFATTLRGSASPVSMWKTSAVR